MKMNVSTRNSLGQVVISFRQVRKELEITGINAFDNMNEKFHRCVHKSTIYSLNHQGKGAFSRRALEPNLFHSTGVIHKSFIKSEVSSNLAPDQERSPGSE